MVDEIDPAAVPDGVVDTLTATGAAAPWVTLTEAGKVHIGAGVTAGVIAQLRLTAPLNDPAGETVRLKDAACPEVTVAEFEDPAAGPMAKSGAAVAVPDKAMFCGLPTALSVTLRLAVALPTAVGAKTTSIVQLAPG